MKQLIKLAWQGVIAVGLALTIGGAALAATPSSSMHVTTERVNSRLLTLSYVVSGDGGTVSHVNLYLNRDGAGWSKVLTSYDTTTPFSVNFDNYGGDGTYEFFTQAVLVTSEEEVLKNTAEISVIVDTVMPPAPDITHIFVNQSADLSQNQVVGVALAAEAYSTVDVYSDSGLTQRLGSGGVAADGSFAPINIGSAANIPYVWVTATDRNGNRSVATLVQNVVSYGEKVKKLITASYTGEMLDLSYDAAPQAVAYLIEYRHANGAVWSARVVTFSTTPKLTDLEAGRSYDIRVAPLDAAGNIGQYAFITTRTAGTRVDTVPLTNVSVGGDALSPVVFATAEPVKQTTTTTKTVAASQVAAEAATDETAADQTATETPTSDTTGEESVTETTPNEGVTEGGDAATTEEVATDAEQSSATPWVILAILIILAGIATGGYFYWFSGPEEVTTSVKSESEKDEDTRW